MLEICQKRGQASLGKSAVWELSKEVQLRPLKDLESNSLRVIKLGPKHGQFIFDNWKFRDDFPDSLDWIISQCKSGLAYGVVDIHQETELISWIIAYKYVCYQKL